MSTPRSESRHDAFPSHSPSPPLTSNGPIEEVEVRGHVIDSLLLPKILDRILALGGTFEIKACQIGARRVDPSYARIAIQAESSAKLKEILDDLVEHGARPVHEHDAQTEPADIAGAFPEHFYSTTNQPTQVRIGGRWVDVADIEMDCGIAIDPEAGTARCIPMNRVQPGMRIVVGATGVRVTPLDRPQELAPFRFMSSGVSSEKPKAASLKSVAEGIRLARRKGEKVLFVAGPAIIHTGSAPHLAQMIREGWIQTLFAGNALAVHDIEASLFQTSLGVSLTRGEAAEHGHEHHLRAINTIRRAGGIRQAVERGILKSGIMYECVNANVEMVLAGSVRDDGPLPEVITDTLEAQAAMRRAIRGVGFAVMIATALHAIATGNLLPAAVPVVCVDINPATVTKLADRGSLQTVGLVTDVEPFLNQLARELETETESNPNPVASS